MNREAHWKQKQVSDKRIVEETLHVGDRVWLFVPAGKNGTTKKLSSLWRGPASGTYRNFKAKSRKI